MIVFSVNLTVTELDDWGRKRVWLGVLDNLPSERRCAAAAGWINSKPEEFFKNHIS